MVLAYGILSSQHLNNVLRRPYRFLLRPDNFRNTIFHQNMQNY